jgi:hypothetical protein
MAVGECARWSCLIIRQSRGIVTNFQGNIWLVRHRYIYMISSWFALEFSASDNNSAVVNFIRNQKPTHTLSPTKKIIRRNIKVYLPHWRVCVCVCEYKMVMSAAKTGKTFIWARDLFAVISIFLFCFRPSALERNRYCLYTSRMYTYTSVKGVYIPMYVRIYIYQGWWLTVKEVKQNKTERNNSQQERKINE